MTNSILPLYYCVLYALPHVIVLIMVDVVQPERNREVLVTSVTDITSVDKKTGYSGYELTLPYDHRFSKKFERLTFYKARIVNDRDVLVSFPSVPFSVLYNRSKLKAVQQENSFRALDTLRHDLGRHGSRLDSDRLFKHLVLRFPEGHKFSAEATNSEVKDKYDELLSELPLVLDKDYRAGFVTWQAANLAGVTNARGRVQSKLSPAKSREAQLAAEMELKANAAKDAGDSDSDGEY